MIYGIKNHLNKFVLACGTVQSPLWIELKFKSLLVSKKRKRKKKDIGKVKIHLKKGISYNYYYFFVRNRQERNFFYAYSLEKTCHFPYCRRYYSISIKNIFG